MYNKKIKKKKTMDIFEVIANIIIENVKVEKMTM